MKVDWTRLVEVLRSHERWLLTSHIRPDADALGSELGMAGVLEAIGKQATIVNGQQTPPNLVFLDPGRRIRAIGVDITAAELADIEAILVLDTSAWIQLGPMADLLRASQAKKYILDHHVSQDDLGAEAFKDTAAEATGRLVLDTARQLGVRLTPAIATPLFAAIATDTGWFRFASTGAGTYRAGAELIDGGAVPADVYRSLYEHDSLARLRLVGCALARAECELAGRLIHTSIQREDFTATGALPSDTEDIINMTLQVEGTEVAVIFVELAAGGVKVSFRSRGKIDCSKLAECFAGGGHKAAAGATIAGTVEAAQGKVLDVVRNAMR
jgi:phosphoesterase RecJ-like protein